MTEAALSGATHPILENDYASERMGIEVNNDGGAISLGHPLGSSGSRIAITLPGRMECEDAKIGLATTCIRVGQGTAMLLECV